MILPRVDPTTGRDFSRGVRRRRDQDRAELGRTPKKATDWNRAGVRSKAVSYAPHSCLGFKNTLISRPNGLPYSVRERSQCFDMHLALSCTAAIILRRKE